MRCNPTWSRRARGFAGAAFVIAAFAGSREAWAIKAPAGATADASRFGLNQFQSPARRSSSVKARAAFAAFNKSHGGGWKIRFDPVTGAASALVGGQGGLARPGKREDAARSFLAEQSNLLDIDPAALSVEKVLSGKEHGHVLFRQTYRGLPVEFSRVKVHFDGRGAVAGLYSGFKPGLSLDVTPSLTAAQAAAAVRRDSGVAPSSRGALVILMDPRTAQARLAWKFTARSKQALWRYYIDAKTGEVVFRYNDLRYVCASQGTISGQVFDLDPTQTPASVRPFNHERVYVVDASTFAETYNDSSGGNGQGFFCSSQSGAMFTQLQGPFVNVSNFQGPSAHYDNNGGQWQTVATPVSSPHPYPLNARLTSAVNVSDPYGATVVKVLPVFTKFTVGAVGSGNGQESNDITIDDSVSILDSFGNPVGAFIGSLGAFNGTAVAGASYSLRLKSTGAGTGQQYGYDVSVSSYLVLPSPSTVGNNLLTWTTDYTFPFPRVGTRLHSEMSLFYHLNLMHDFFKDGVVYDPLAPPVPPDGLTPLYPGVDASGAADIDSAPVNALVLVGPNMAGPFYNPDDDNFVFGDGLDASPNDMQADDATASHHEYTHYVVQKIWNIQNFGQAGAISEGNADYFSATSLNDSAIGSYFNGGTPLRDIDCQKPGVTCAVLCPTTSITSNCNANWHGEIHADAIFFSQARWDIRRDQIARLGAADGQACADGLMFQALTYFPESFQEYMDAMLNLDALGAVTACGGAGVANSSIINNFSLHGLPFGAGNSGFESALDVSTMSSTAGTIYPAGAENFYTFAAGPGPIQIAMTLPPHRQPSDGYFMGYYLTLFSRNHEVVATAQPQLGTCDAADCESLEQNVVLTYTNPSGGGGQFYLMVSAEYTADGSNSGANSLLPYTLDFSYAKTGALTGGVAIHSFDNDIISFSVNVTTLGVAHTPNFTFAYAQLRDHNQKPLDETRTDIPGGYLTVVYSSASGAVIAGQLQLQQALGPGHNLQGFSARYPAEGAVYLEVFGLNPYNVSLSTVSLGLSPPINLTANATALTAYNNIFNPALGQKATIRYELLTAGHVTLKLYTLNGNLVATLLDADEPAGKGNSVDWDGSNRAGVRVASGIYLLHMRAPGISKTQKIVVVK